MSEISDMLRESADDMERNPGVAQHFSPQLLRRLADRIDKTMVEWPLGADKKRIKPGQTVYDPCGGEWDVTGVVLPIIPAIALVTLERDGTEITRFSADLTHECPDSLGRIADDMRAEIESLEHGSFASDDALDALRDYEARIRRLAERDEER